MLHIRPRHCRPRSDRREIWANPFTPLRVPLIFNLRRDSDERARITSNTYDDRLIDPVYFPVPAQSYVANLLGTFQELPPRQKAASFRIDLTLKMLEVGPGASS